MTSINKTYLFAAILFLFLTFLMLWPSYTLLVKPRHNGFDWYPIWLGGRAILAGENPYNLETSQQIHVAVYGQLPAAGGYVHGFSHPPYLAFILFPFIALPFFWSVWLWVALQLPLYGATLGLGLHLLKWRPSPLQLAGLLFLTTLGYRYPMIIYVLGQLGIWVLFCLVLSMWLFQQGHVRSSAVALAGSTIRPDLALFAILLALFLIRAHPQRMKFIITLIGCGFILLLLPMPFIGFWPFMWLKWTVDYGNNPNPTWPPGVLVYRGAQLIFILAMFIWGLRYVIMAWRKPTRFAYTLLISATVLLMLLILPQTGSYNLIFALIPALILSHHAPSRQVKSVILASLLMPWFYFMLGETFRHLIFLLIPGQFILWQEWVLYYRPVSD